MKKKNLYVYLYFIPLVIFYLCMQLLSYMFSTLMSLKDRLRLKLKVKTEISIMLDHPWQSSTTVLWDTYTYMYRVFSPGRLRIAGHYAFAFLRIADNKLTNS